VKRKSTVRRRASVRKPYVKRAYKRAHTGYHSYKKQNRMASCKSCEKIPYYDTRYFNAEGIFKNI